MFFVVPCKFDPQRPVIFDCIKSIQKWHDNPKILVVDSGSQNRSYLNWCLDHHCKVAAINNQLYSFGAHAWAMRHYGEVEFFAFIMDSLLITGNLDHLEKQPLTTVRHFSSSVHDWGWDSTGEHLSVWGKEQLDRMGVPLPDVYTGILGPIMFANRDVIDRLDYELGYWFTQTTDKFQLCGMERVAGICLSHLGYNPENSLQGHHWRHEDAYDESLVMKLNMARM